MMYATVLWAHSWVRWVILLSGLVVWFRAIGSATRQNACQGLCPSTRAASIRPLPWARNAPPDS